MSNPQAVDPNGRRADIEDRSAGRAVLRLESGERIDLPEALLRQDSDGSYRSSVEFDRLLNDEADGQEVFLEVEEHLEVDREAREKGRVRVTRRVETDEQVLDESSWRERVEVERVPKGTYVTQSESIREEDGVTIIPVYEEVLVVERRLLLKEEVHLRKSREEIREPQRHTVRRTVIDIDRSAGESSSPD
jgi:stress response protein YsnF